MTSDAQIRDAFLEVLALAAKRGWEPDTFVGAMADGIATVAALLDYQEGPLACPLDVRLDAMIQRIRQTYRKALNDHASTLQKVP